MFFLFMECTGCPRLTQSFRWPVLSPTARVFCHCAVRSPRQSSPSPLTPLLPVTENSATVTHHKNVLDKVNLHLRHKLTQKHML